MGKGKSRITNRIRELRARADNMTQQALAEQVGVTRQTIIAIENDRYSPSLEVAFRIAESLEVPIDRVFRHEPIETDRD